MPIKDREARQAADRARYQARKLDPEFVAARRARRRAAYAENPDKARAMKASYYRRNSEKVRAARKKYLAELPAEEKERQRIVNINAGRALRRKYRSQKQAAQRETMRRWRENNPERNRALYAAAAKKSRVGINRSYVAALLGVPASNLSDEYVAAHAAALKLKRLLWRLKNENT